RIFDTDIGSTWKRWPLIDRERVLARLSELEGYLQELRAIAPASFEEFLRTEKKRACERLLQIAVEAVIDICHLLVVGMRLGLPSEENDLIVKLERAGILSADVSAILKKMRGFRNILVHEYGEVNDRIVFAAATSDFEDFDRFRREVLAALPS